MSVLLTKPPRRFGQAEVVFGDEDRWGLPERTDDQILFPAPFDDARMFSLMDGQQFLATPRNPEKVGFSNGVFFGGTDEAPFLAELGRVHWAILIETGEAAFYDSLKPHQMKAYESVFGGQAVRQGDIWALALPMTWEQLASYYSRSTRGDKLNLSHGSMAVMDTRHVVEGTWATERPRIPYQEPGSYKFNRRHWPIRNDVVEGALTAPDHAPLTLDGPHVLVRTTAFAPPRRAPGVGWE